MAKPIPSKSAALSASQVKIFLEKNPAFFFDHPELLQTLQIPDAWLDEDGKTADVVDFRAALIAHLQKILAMRVAENHHLVCVTRLNIDTQKRIHDLALKMLQTDSIEALLAMLEHEIPSALELEKIVLCAAPLDVPREWHKLNFEPLRLIDGTSLPQFDLERVLFRSHIDAEPEFYGETKIHSDILIALDLPHTRAMLAFGSRIPEKFDDAQSADLMIFLTDIFAAMLQRHLSA